MNYVIESKKTLERLFNEEVFLRLSKSQREEISARLTKQFPRLFTHFHHIYGWQYDFYYHLQQLFAVIVRGFAERPEHLKAKDKQKAKHPNWYKSNKMLGMAIYVDLFGGDIAGLRARIPYFKRLGVTYLHLMPLFQCPKGENDGGYAVTDYRNVMPRLGTIDDLKGLSKDLNDAGINLVLDFVFNHTSDEHEWAMLAKQGEHEFQQYYYMFDDKAIPNAYETHLREIFPQVRRGNFTFNVDSQKWVWTTFNNFQWDLNYSNPAVFTKIAAEMLFLANIGGDALRLDALAFIWKEMGTDCENLDKAHTLIQAFNACLQIAAPSVVFKSEAIVHPDEVVKYIDRKECQLSYNPLLMALIWNSLATRKTRLITASLQKTNTINDHCSWVNYARCHDDIGWTFDDSVAAELGINGDDHRHFLNQFYTGRFEGSFANGIAFGENPETGDCRVCGSLASLCGLESALATNNQADIESAVSRIVLVHSIILSFGGIPLLYAGDEFALLNDYSYQQNTEQKDDARWVHRIEVSDDVLAGRVSPTQLSVQSKLNHLISLRQTHPILGDANTQVLNAPNQHCFAYLRVSNLGERCLCIVNFSEHTLVLPSAIMRCLESKIALELITSTTYECSKPISLQAYQCLWLKS
ncbi:amylosucrase [Glaciecola sp. KUL10]|uniref:amylosucrase n=1 Tax=Glaciecola sp. (strain KUL10) TaxID=2161813 RepID=UPI000D78980A|nr:alpha amylase [Glaciecola sp. KUL10]